MIRSEEEGLRKAVVLLAKHLRREVDQLKLERHSSPGVLDATVVADSTTFALDFSRRATSESILRSAHRLKNYQQNAASAVVPLLVVPYMGRAGSFLCEREGLSWLDLSGNADIRAEGLTIRVSGCPNQYKRRGRPKSLFAAQSTRVTRWLLMNPDSAFTHSYIMEQTRLDRAHVSRILRRMTADGYIRHMTDRSYRLTDGPRLLHDWYESSTFSKHEVLAGSCFSRSGPMLVSELTRLLAESRTRFAFTGLAAAWLYTKHVSFSLTTLFVDVSVDKPLKARLGFHEDVRGANTWLVQPNDDGVFDGTRLVDGVQCVHPVQVYIDLKGQPERATEASNEILKLNDLVPLTTT